MTAPLDLRKVAEATRTRNVWIGSEHGEAIAAMLDDNDRLTAAASSKRARAAAFLTDAEINGILDANDALTEDDAL